MYARMTKIGVKMCREQNGQMEGSISEKEEEGYGGDVLSIQSIIV